MFGIGIGIPVRINARTAAAANPEWWVVDTDQYIVAGGREGTGFTGATTYGGGSSTGRTVLHSDEALKIRRNCTILRIAVRVVQLGVASGWQFKVFRKNGSTYDFVAESQTFTPTAQGYQLITLSPSITAQAGDVIGLFMAGNATSTLESLANAIGTGIREDANVSASGEDFATSAASTAPQLEAHCRPPFLAVTGDSWVGSHAGQQYKTRFGLTQTYDPARLSSEVMHQMVTLGYVDADFSYENCALGGMMYDWVASTGAPAAIGTRAPAILMIAGGNDIRNGRTWSQIEANLNTIKALLLPHQHLFVSEVGPGQGYDDTEAATMRTNNTNFATWCTANGATLILIHDDLAQIRVSTGQLDNLKTAYNQDDLHLTQAGCNRLAELWADAITAYYEANPSIASDALVSSPIADPTLLYSGTATASSTTQVSSSISPAANSLLIIVCGNAAGAGTLTPLTVTDALSGGSLNWTEEALQGSGTGIYAAGWAWAVTGATPGSGAVTATWNVAGTRKTMQIWQFATGVDLNSPIVQSKISQNGATSATVTLDTTPLSDGYVMAFVHSKDDADAWPTVLTTEMLDLFLSPGSNQTVLMTHYNKGGRAIPSTPQAAVIATALTASNNVFAAIEIRAT